MTPPQLQARIAAELLRIEDPQERLAYVLDRVKKNPRIDDSLRSEDRLLRGCATKVWLLAEHTPKGTCSFQVDSESAMVRGLASLITEVYADCAPGDIVRFDCTVLSEARLERCITPTRLLGLAQLQRTIQAFARESLSDSGSPASPRANPSPN
jgi:cysteine desulfuration protein SufE